MICSQLLAMQQAQEHRDGYHQVMQFVARQLQPEPAVGHHYIG